MFGKNKLYPFNGLHIPAAFATIFQVASAAISIGSAIKQYQSSKDAAKAQKLSQQAQAQMSAAQEARNRIQAVREARIKRAMIVSASGQQGMGQTGSGPAGSTAAVGSQYGQNIGYSNVVQSFAQQASEANQQAIDASSSVQMWQTIGGIAQKVTPWNEMFGGGVNRQVGTSPWIKA